MWKSLGSFIKRVDKCKNCRLIKDRKEMFNRIKKEFEEQDCELLETEYINNRTKISYKTIKTFDHECRLNNNQGRVIKVATVILFYFI